MKTATEIEIKFLGAEVTEIEDDMFILVEASKLSMNDKFMQYEPETRWEHNFKELLAEAIKNGVKDFKRPKCDPSFKEGGICYEFGKAPALGKSYNWWARTAKQFLPGRSRLGTKTEYVVFLGVLIKKMVENGWTVAEAWDSVCNDSNNLGHYWKSKDAKHDFEATGCREICGFCDLANCHKILAEDEENSGFWLAGGCYNSNSYYYPLVHLHHDIYQNDDLIGSVGWIVLD